MITIPVRVSVSNVSVPVGITTDVALPVVVSTPDIPALVSTSQVSIPARVDADPELSVKAGTAYQAAQYPTYTGQYVFTPTRETQIAHTKERVLVDDIVINPIPSNYGLVTYNGAFITVS